MNRIIKNKFRLLSLDISSRTGWAIFDADGSNITLNSYSNIDFKKLTPLKMKYKADETNHPYDFIDFSLMVAGSMLDIIKAQNITHIVIEQTNSGRDRYRQKLLEFLHYALADLIRKSGLEISINYMDTSEWRGYLEIRLSKEERKNNKVLAKQKANGEIKIMKGKMDAKKLALKYVKDNFDLDFKMKENDIAEAICMGLSFLKKLKEKGELYEIRIDS